MNTVYATVDDLMTLSKHQQCCIDTYAFIHLFSGKILAAIFPKRWHANEHMTSSGHVLPSAEFVADLPTAWNVLSSDSREVMLGKIQKATGHGAFAPGL